MAQQVFEQLPLSVQLKDDATFDNYYTAENAEAVMHLQKASVGEGEQCLYIWGEPGVGCSHLLQAACHQAESVERNIRRVGGIFTSYFRKSGKSTADFSR